MKSVSRSLRQTLISVVATAVIFSCLAIWTAAGVEPARAVVERFNSTLLTTMRQGQDLRFAGRYEKIAPRIDDDFDMRTIAKRSLGAGWPRLDEAQRDAYIARLRQDAIAGYARHFDRYAGQRFAVTGLHKPNPERRRVDTVIIDSDGHRQPVSYSVANRNGKWRIVAVRGAASGFSVDTANARVLRQNAPKTSFSKTGRDLDQYPASPGRPTSV